MSHCKRCLISDKVPGVQVNADKICNLCLSFDPKDLVKREEERKGRLENLEKALNDCRNKGEYDCLVPLSGGKDSIYLLYKLKVEYGLNVLAYTTDINIPAIAWDNIRTALKKLDIDHLVYRPSDDFYKKLFRHLLKNQEPRGAVYTVSYVYAPLFEGDAIKTAMEKNIPLILAGYSPGQPEPGRMLYEFSRKLIEEIDWTPPALRDSGVFEKSELSRFFNPSDYPKSTTFPRYLAPFHAWEYNQESVMTKVVELGLVKSAKHASPIFSNYPINWLLMYSDLKNFGFNPYLPEFAALIREGKASLQQWKVMIPMVNFMISQKVLLGKDVKSSLEWLGLIEKDLVINQDFGAYDPPGFSGEIPLEFKKTKVS